MSAPCPECDVEVQPIVREIEGGDGPKCPICQTTVFDT